VSVTRDMDREALAQRPSLDCVGVFFYEVLDQFQRPLIGASVMERQPIRIVSFFERGTPLLY